MRDGGEGERESERARVRERESRECENDRTKQGQCLLYGIAPPRPEKKAESMKAQGRAAPVTSW